MKQEISKGRNSYQFKIEGGKSHKISSWKLMGSIQFPSVVRNLMFLDLFWSGEKSVSGELLAHQVCEEGAKEWVCCCCLGYSPWWGNLKRGWVKKFLSFWREMTGVAQAMPVVRSMAADVLRKAKRLGKAVLSWRTGEFSIRAACRARWATHAHSEGKDVCPYRDAEMGVAS